MDANSAKHACNVTRRISFGDRYVIANTGAVFRAFGECRKSRGKKKSNGEEQSTHKKTSWASVRLELICGVVHSHQPRQDTARNALWMLPLRHP
jgi:hypothetical protein